MTKFEIKDIESAIEIFQFLESQGYNTKIEKKSVPSPNDHHLCIKDGVLTIGVVNDNTKPEDTKPEEYYVVTKTITNIISSSLGKSDDSTSKKSDDSQPKGGSKYTIKIGGKRKTVKKSKSKRTN